VKAKFAEFQFHDVGCIKEPGPDLYDPGSLRINLRLLAVLVKGTEARTLVGVEEIRPASVLALLLRRWEATHPEGYFS
jgi:hypothetical protein